MGLHGKLVAAIEFKAGGDVFHELFRDRPHAVPTASNSIKACELHDGQFGKVGSVLCWKYVYGGKNRIDKVTVQKIDEGKRLIEFNIIGGDLVEKYKAFLVMLHIEESVKKPGVELVTWSLEYEKLKDDVEDPIWFLTFFIELTKEIEAHHVGKP